MASASSEDHAYFQAIEETFIRLRGSPLLLSPADWQVARRWHRQGIPLELVRRCLEELFRERERRKARGKVQSLRYVASKVEEEWDRVRELAAGSERGEAPRFDLPARLEALARALPARLAGRERWAGRITALDGDLETVEEALMELDRELLEAIEAELDDDERRALEAEASESLAPLAPRLAAEQRQRSERELFRRLLRKRFELPLLSLFSPAAEG